MITDLSARFNIERVGHVERLKKLHVHVEQSGGLFEIGHAAEKITPAANASRETQPRRGTKKEWARLQYAANPGTLDQQLRPLLANRK